MSHARYISRMAQTQPSRLSSADRRAAAFGDWLREELTRRGYDLSTRGGGQKRLARESGISPSSISRLINGTARNPDPDTLKSLARALALPLGEILVRAGTLTRDELAAIQSTTVIDRPPITPEEAAADLGITDDDALVLYEAGISAAREVQRRRLRERAE